jgi:hypothetical protein
MKTLIRYLVIATATLGAPAVSELTGYSQALGRHNVEQLDKHCEKYSYLIKPSKEFREMNYNHARYSLDFLLATAGAVFSIANCRKD